MKKVTIMFGEMGSGKTYLGTRFAKANGAVFFDGDSVVPPEMAEKVSAFKPLTRDILDRYLDILFDEIADRAAKCEHLVVAQALYSDQDRKDLELFLISMAYEVEFIWIRTGFFRNLRQLLSRPNGWRWVGYWLMNKPWFRWPTHKSRVV